MKYKLTEEHKKLIPEHNQYWIDNALSTRRITEDEKPKIKELIKELYRCGGVTPPPDNRIIFVSSPFVARFAGGFASWIWYLRKNKTNFATDTAISAATSAVTRDVTYAATSAVTRDVTYAATCAATDDATNDATSNATYASTSDATYDATDNAIRDAISDATDASTYAATSAATSDATYDATDDATYDATYNAIRAATSTATRDATRDATYAATDAATRDATRDATYAATDAATSNATRDATYAATDAATSDATRDAIRAATYSKNTNTKENWYFVNGDMKMCASMFGNVKILLECANKAYRMYQGGNFWSGTSSFIEFGRNIAKLDLDYSKWDCYKQLSELSSYRIMHSEFCLISERPTKLMVDDQNRPHCEDGAFCEWADGSKLYSYHGVRVPGYILENPNKITIEKIQKEQNLEVQRVMINKYGIERYLVEIDAKVIDFDIRGIEGGGARTLLREKNGQQWLVCTDGSTERVYHLAVSENVKTCREAHEELSGFSEKLIQMEG